VRISDCRLPRMRAGSGGAGTKSRMRTLPLVPAMPGNVY